jgi:ubiquinone biosynthesis protein
MNSPTASLDRHKRITLLFLKHAPRPSCPLDAASARCIARDIEDLGGPFIRAAKMLSVREDLLPATALDAFASLEDHRLDDLEPESAEVIDQVVEEELGKKTFRAFTSFHPVPAGFSGIGQIHHATLHDGRHVLVRVQRPRLRKRIVEDLATLTEIAAFLDDPSGRAPSHFSRLLDRLRLELLRELDYRHEEAALNALRDALEGRERLRVPVVMHEFSSSRVLTTEFIDGSELWEIPSLPSEKDSRELVSQFLSGHLDELLFHGRIHPQPHLENLLLTHDGEIAIIGATGSVTLPNADRLMLHHFLSGLCERNAETTAEALGRFARSSSCRIATDEFIASLDGPLQKIAIADRVLAAARVACVHGCPPPPAVCRVADLFRHLSAACAILCPAFDTEAFMAAYLSRHLTDDGDKAVRFSSHTAA